LLVNIKSIIVFARDIKSIFINDSGGLDRSLLSAKNRRTVLLSLLIERVISKYINFRRITYNINRINRYRNISVEILLINIIKYSQKVIQIYV
jgi:hypothetical protein